MSQKTDVIKIKGEESFKIKIVLKTAKVSSKIKPEIISIYGSSVTFHNSFIQMLGIEIRV